jgi:23S rRNA (cytosine1962-C5)-methyltransferase
VISYSPILDAIEQADVSENELRRIFHGRGHCFPSLEHINLDFYPPFLFLTSYQEIETDELERLVHQVWNKASVYADFITGLVYQQRAGRETSSRVFYGTLPSPHIVVELGLSYQVDLLTHQNTGIFPDMRNGRSFVVSQSKHKKVLNLFSYTCGFSLAAMHGGATSVVNMDMNKGVLAQGKVNHKLNGFDENVRFFPHDILKSFGKLKKLGPFELIIIDPPSFQKGSFELTKDYQKILRRLSDIVSNKATLLLCANSPDLTEKKFMELITEHAGDGFNFEYRLESALGFPEKDQNKNLKALVYRYHGL